MIEFVYQNIKELYLIKDILQTAEEIFVVNKVLNTKPITYKIVNLMGEEVKGSFYEKELQKQNKKHLELKGIETR